MTRSSFDGRLAAACGLFVTMLALAACDGSPRHARPARVQPALSTDAEFAAEVREAFLHAWNGYTEFAWGHDALKPLSRDFREAKELILERLAFDHDMTVQVFEINIRILGGLLSAYQIDGDPRFLELATDLANRLLPAFESPTGLPYVRVNLASGATEWAGNNPAEIGTLTLEFGLLSRLTGDPRYYDAAKRAVTTLFEKRSPLGLVGTVIDVESGEWLDSESHISGMIDSYYEYLLKAWLLFGDEDFRRMWEASRDAINLHLATEVDGSLWYGRVDMATGESTGTTFDVEPESFDFTTMAVNYPAYPLRPEAIESAYYLFVLTGDERYREMGRDIFRRIVRWTRTDHGFAHLTDVRTKEKDDAMESFFFAETLKYAYLLADPNAIDFDAVIFNTEAHPFVQSSG